MKIFKYWLCSVALITLFAQEETLEHFYKISQENLNNYSLADLADLDPTQDYTLAKLFNHQWEEAQKILLTLHSIQFRLVATQEVVIQEQQRKKAEGENYQLPADLQNHYQWYKNKAGEDLLLELYPQHPDYTQEGADNSIYNFNGSKIQSVTESIDKFSGQIVAFFKFYPSIAKNFGDFTEKYLNRQLAILYNDFVIFSPVIRTRIDGEAVITGLSKEEVKSLVSAIQIKNLVSLLDCGNPPDPKTFLFLKTIHTLSLSQAKILSQFQGRLLFLNGLTEIDTEVALLLRPIRLKIHATESVLKKIRGY